MEKILIEQFEEYLKMHLETHHKMPSVEAFDCWLSGWVIGYSTSKDLSIEDMKRLTDALVNSEIVKSLGITGTETENFQTKTLQAPNVASK